MKIISYNVNGIRAAVSKGMLEWLEKESPDIICLQEIKALEDQIDLLSLQALGYNYNYFHSAQKKGYSGVAILSKLKPDNIQKGMGIDIYDQEGRVIRFDYRELSIYSVYIPSGTMGTTRQDFKMQFLEDFYTFMLKERSERKEIIVCGDYNICHKPIDINHPERHLKSSGFLPEEREWFDKFILTGMIDSFREFDSGSEKYSWWSYRAGAKSKNLGWRIDYHLISDEVRPKLQSASILSDIIYSDHCPVSIEINIDG